MNEVSRVQKWKYCVPVCVAMTLLSLLPQIHLWTVLGRQWNGAYVSSQGDEFLYSAYLNSLLENRGRKNDPYAGNITQKTPAAESAFSIQLVPPYVILFFARMFGASAATTMIGVIAAAGLLASLTVFWLLIAVNSDPRFAAAGTLFVLCLGGIAAGSVLYPTLPFLRRYQPAAAFPLFFVFIGLVWLSLTNSRRRGALISALGAGLTLSALILSYLYLWIGALAWFGCISLLWLLFRPSHRVRTSQIVATITILAGLAFILWGILVSNRAPTLDMQQTLLRTRQLDLFRMPEMLGLLVLATLAIGVWLRKISFNQPRFLYACSLAMLPFVVFNQQVLTGRSIQPHHFGLFVVNYAVLLAAVVCIPLLWAAISSRSLMWIAALSLSWGLFEVALPARLATVPAAIAQDRWVPIFKRLKQRTNQDNQVSGTANQSSNLVFSPNIGAILALPTWTAQGTLLDMGALDFGSVSAEERKEFFLLHLYYCGADLATLREALNEKTPDAQMNYYARSVIFGHERVLSELSYQFKPIRQDEIEHELQNYQTFINSLSRSGVLKRPIGYAVVPAGNFDFAAIDRWYERDAGERIGDYVLYRLTLRP